MDHGESQSAALLDVKFRNAQMQGGHHSVRRGAARDDVDFGETLE